MKQFEFYLINGRFEAADAGQLLSELSGVKVKYHLQRLSLPDVEEETIKHSENRIKNLEEALRQMMQIVRQAAREGRKVDVEGFIKIKEA